VQYKIFSEVFIYTLFCLPRVLVPSLIVVSNEMTLKRFLCFFILIRFTHCKTVSTARRDPGSLTKYRASGCGQPSRVFIPIGMFPFCLNLRCPYACPVERTPEIQEDLQMKYSTFSRVKHRSIIS
jgi:hypothetical protein